MKHSDLILLREERSNNPFSISIQKKCLKSIIGDLRPFQIDTEGFKILRMEMFAQVWKGQ